MKIDEILRVLIRNTKMGSDERNFYKYFLGEIKYEKYQRPLKILQNLAKERPFLRKGDEIEAARIALEREILTYLIEMAK